ncbi:Retrovirus-related Pol polyprotein from transposon TNT 1-94 [Hibiscus syriacus]|uniref:Retrovirus-related Pol polyprotein from transposon TNT 1-94 n=1 Tax=Hibiscus syriacus TaxID=106335 RepID=A0A6A3B807_HIBSY|nr:Retrovirus-related Pol polyprotein from transposon TNT 1-94 [Hibiscus syriacus]
MAASELIQLRRHTVSVLREGFRNRLETIVCGQASGNSETTSSNVIDDSRNEFPQSNAFQDAQSDENEHTQSRSSESDVTWSQTGDMLSNNIAVESKSWQGNSNRGGNWQEPTTNGEQASWPQPTYAQFNEWREGNAEELDTNWQEGSVSEYNEENPGNVNGEESHEQGGQRVWHDDGSREAVDNWSEGPSGRAIPIRRFNRFHPPEDDNVYSMELRELLRRYLITSITRARSEKQRDEINNDRNDTINRPSRVLPSPPVPPPQPHYGIETYIAPVGIGTACIDQKRFLSESIINVLEEWEMVNDIRADMTRLQQGMSHMQRMLEACMDRQLELQRSVRQEVSAALNRSAGEKDADTCALVRNARTSWFVGEENSHNAEHPSWSCDFALSDSRLPQQLMKAILRKDGCLAAISERPVDFTDDNKWIEMDGNDMANFHLALADEVLSSIEEKNTAKKIWDHLTKLYEATSLHNKIFLKRKLYTLRMPESTSVTEHLNTLNTLFSQLTSLSCKIGEQGRTELLLQSLPDSYDQLIINLTNSNVTSLVFDDVAAAVLQEENRRKNKENRQVNLQQAEALTTMTTMRGRSTERGQSSSHKHGGSVYSCNDHALEIVGVGTIKLKMYDGTIKVVRDVRHVKGLKKNLLSYGLLDNNASKIETRKRIMKVFRGALVVLKGEKIAANLYMLKGETLLEAEASVASCSSNSAMLWHQKLGHMSEQGMKVLVEQKLLPGLTKVSLSLCEHCITSKQHRLKFNTSNSRGKNVLELVHSDVWQAPVTSLGGAKYFVSFIDDYSRRCWVHPIKKKSDVFSTFKNFKARVELDYGNKIKCFRTDNGGEYTSEEFDDFCKKEGIKRQFTVANTLQQNGVAERMNRTLLERTRAMLRDAGLEKSFWAEAVNTACYLVNRAPSTAIELKTPMEMWTGMKPIGNKWVFKIKRNGDDQVERYRARLVVKGYAQKEGIDFNEIFSHVVRLTTVRVVLAMCATLNLHLEQLDVKTAFLHGNLEEEIYMLQPEGFEEKEKKNLVCKLNKSLYGLKQAPRCWYKRFDSFIMCLGYNRLNADPCAYFKRSGDNDFVILLLYVDDMLVAGPNKDHIEELKAQLAREFEMKDLGSANKILGMQIHRDRSNRNIWLSQKNYLKKILSRFNMQDCKPISTTLPINFKLSSSMSPSSEEDRMKMSRVPYASAVRSLMFAMICTRPDIAQAVGVVSQYMANPGKEHWNTVKRILRYIKGTSNVALCYGGSNLLINGYDSDYAGDLDKSKSTTGYVFKVTGGAVSWVSKLQSVVATSTTEAEYVAATQASKEAIWLKMLLEELGHNQEYVSLFCDSQSALHLARNPSFHSRTKHIRVQYHFIREKVEEGTVDIQKIHTKDNIADFMTKAINADKFTWCRSSCGLSETCDFALSDSRLPQHTR